MKKRIDAYTFDKTAKTITLTGYTTIDLDGILLITNVTDNIIMYNFADPNSKVTVLNNVITLAYDTSSMDNSDNIQIFYDDALEYGLTDSELRNTPIPISGTVVTGGLTDVQLRATDLPVTLSGETVDISASSLPLPSGASIESKQDLIITALSNLLTELQRKADLTETQPVSGPLTDIQLRASTVPVSDASILTQMQTLNTDDATFMMRYLVSIMSDPVYLNKVSNALQVLLLPGSTTAVTGTLTGVTTVTGLTNIGGVGADKVVEHLFNISWNNLRGLMI